MSRKNTKSPRQSQDPMPINEIFKQVTNISSKNIVFYVSRHMVNLLNVVHNCDYKSSPDLPKQLVLTLWSSMSLLSLIEVQCQVGVDNFEAEYLKRKIEREHARILEIIIQYYKNNDDFLRDYLAFITIADLWNNPTVSNYLLDMIPSGIVYADEFVKNTCILMIHEYWKKDGELAKKIANSLSYIMLDKDWPSTSYGSQLCIEYLLDTFEAIYDHDEQRNLTTVDYIMKLMRYFVERMSQPEHISDLLELLCFWMYIHAKNIHQVLNIGSLIFSCCDLYHPLIMQLSLKHFFQKTIFCMINSDDMSTVSVGFDILISIVDRFGNKDVLSNPKIYNIGELPQLKKPTRRNSVEETLFFRYDFLHMTDSIHKVVINSIHKFFPSKIIARKVNTLVSLLAVEGSDSAQGLTLLISFALSIQYEMLKKSRRLSKAVSFHDESLSLDRDTVRYHGCVASWFSLVCSVNSGDLDLLRNYIKSVIDLRADSAPYLLPSQENIPLLPHYIFELDKSLYFDIDQIQAAVENSWVILTNNRDLLNNIKIPRSNNLVEKYVDIQLLDSFNVFLFDDKQQPDQDTSESVFHIDDVDSLFTDIENRYSDAFTEPFDRFIFNEDENTVGNY